MSLPPLCSTRKVMDLMTNRITNTNGGWILSNKRICKQYKIKTKKSKILSFFVHRPEKPYNSAGESVWELNSTMTNFRGMLYCFNYILSKNVIADIHGKKIWNH